MSYQVKLFSGTNTQYLSTEVAASYGQELGKVTMLRFSDGEFQASFEETVRGNDVFIIQSTFPPSDNLFELLQMIDAAKRASAHQIIAVIPYFGCARQDRKDKPRVTIGAKLVANLLSAAGATRLITMDLHADQIQGFFDFPVDHLYASTIFLPYIESLGLENLVMASPDMGGSKRAHAYAKHLKSDIAICYKERSKANVVDRMTLVGDVEGCDVVLVDDLIDTGGTLAKAANMLVERGAKSVRAVCTHAVLSGNAYETIESSKLTELVVTNTVPLKRESDKIRVLSVAELFAKVLHSVHSHESISSHFVF